METFTLHCCYAHASAPTSNAYFELAYSQATENRSKTKETQEGLVGTPQSRRRSVLAASNTQDVRWDEQIRGNFDKEHLPTSELCGKTTTHDPDAVARAQQALETWRDRYSPKNSYDLCDFVRNYRRPVAHHTCGKELHHYQGDPDKGQFCYCTAPVDWNYGNFDSEAGSWVMVDEALCHDREDGITRTAMEVVSIYSLLGCDEVQVFDKN